MDDYDDFMPPLVGIGAGIGAGTGTGTGIGAGTGTKTGSSYPLCFHNTLLESEITERECSDGIYLSSDRFRHFNRVDSDALVIISITRGERTAYANIVGVHSEDADMVFMPTWMCQYLGTDCGDTVVLSNLNDYRMGTTLRIQPHTSEYIKLDDPVAALRDGFENYTVLTAGLTIPLFVGGARLVVSLLDTGHIGPVCIRGMELNVEIEQPLDVVNEPAHKRQRVESANVIEESLPLPLLAPVDEIPFDFNCMIPMPVPVDNRFPGRGRTLGSKK